MLGFGLSGPSHRQVCGTHEVTSIWVEHGPWIKRATPWFPWLLPPSVSVGLLRRLGGALSFLSSGFFRLSRDFLGL